MHDGPVVNILDCQWWVESSNSSQRLQIFQDSLEQQEGVTAEVRLLR